MRKVIFIHQRLINNKLVANSVITIPLIWGNLSEPHHMRSTQCTLPFCLIDDLLDTPSLIWLITI